jgi:hypothetical protein
MYAKQVGNLLIAVKADDREKQSAKYFEKIFIITHEVRDIRTIKFLGILNFRYWLHV